MMRIRGSCIPLDTVASLAGPSPRHAFLSYTIASQTQLSGTPSVLGDAESLWRTFIASRVSNGLAESYEQSSLRVLRQLDFREHQSYWNSAKGGKRRPREMAVQQR